MTESPARPSLLVVVGGHPAEAAWRQTLARLPEAIFEDFDTEILLVVDATGGSDAANGRQLVDKPPGARLRMLRNLLDPGHGGHQKVGLTEAIRRGFDFVAAIDGRGRSAPEALPQLLEPLVQGEADGVIASRFLASGAAGRSGMPLLQRLRARALGVALDALSGGGLSDPHSGMRAFRVDALERVPFLLATNESHFDPQIVLQLLNAGLRVVERPVPAHPDPPERGWRYAAKSLLWSLRNVAHRSGVLYQRALDTDRGHNTHYALKLGYASSHTYAIDAVPAGASVLDLGSGPGELARELVAKGCRVTVVDRFPPPPEAADLDHVVQDLDEPLCFRVDGYDYILLLDILEHLRSPESFLEQLRELFDHRPRTVILTTPNVGFFVQRCMLLLGQFNYGKKGVLDLTHTRLFTFRSLRRLLRECGFKIRKVKGVPAPFPLVFGDGFLGRSAVAVNRGLIALSRSLFSYQIFVEMTTTPGVDYILRQAPADEPKSQARPSHRGS